MKKPFENLSSAEKQARDYAANTIIKGLNSIRRRIQPRKFPFRTALEDVHVDIEARLSDKVGDVAGKLRSEDRQRKKRIVTSAK
jgi:argininosuccinate lyase